MHFLPLSITIMITTNESWNTETQNRSKSTNRGIEMAAQAGWEFAGGYPPGFFIRVPINDDTRGGGRPRCPCVGRHRTSWLVGNSRGRWQWPVRPSLLNPILSDKVGRSPYSSALVTRSRQLALRTRRKNVGLNFGPISKPRKSFWWISKSRVRVIFVSQSLEFFSVFFCRGVSESRICHFFFPFGLQESNYWEFTRVHRYSLSNWASRLRK